MNIYNGSVTEMPFDNKLFDGIFCYGLIYLLDKAERNKLIHACFNQLTDNGYMIFTAVTKGAPTYGQGTLISKDRFEMFGGVKIFCSCRLTLERCRAPLIAAVPRSRGWFCALARGPGTGPGEQYKRIAG